MRSRFGKGTRMTSEMHSLWPRLCNDRRHDVLSPRMLRIVSDLAGDWRQLDDRIETVTDEIETLAKNDDSCRRVMTVPGIGPIISSAMVAAIGNGSAFSRGRDYSAWLGLVPKQMSTGDR